MGLRVDEGGLGCKKSVAITVDNGTEDQSWVTDSDWWQIRLDKSDMDRWEPVNSGLG